MNGPLCILCVETLGLSYTETKETKHPKQMQPLFFTVFLTIRHAEQNLSLPCMHYRTLFSKVSFRINCRMNNFFIFIHIHSLVAWIYDSQWIMFLKNWKICSWKEIRNLSQATYCSSWKLQNSYWIRQHFLTITMAAVGDFCPKRIWHKSQF